MKIKKISQTIILLFILVNVIVSCKDKDSETLEERAARLKKELNLKYYNIQEVSVARIVKEGILFTFAENYNTVEVSGDFNNWQESIPLLKGSYGVFYYLFQTPLKAGKYTYRYRVNNVWMNDPLQENITYDNVNQAVSYFVVDKDMEFFNSNPIYNNDGTVTFFYSNSQAKEVMFTSSELGFNTSRYTMNKTNNNYMWFITLQVHNGPYYYNFVADRVWYTDPINWNVMLGNDERLHSYILIKNK